MARFIQEVPTGLLFIRGVANITKSKLHISFKAPAYSSYIYCCTDYSLHRFPVLMQLQQQQPLQVVPTVVWAAEPTVHSVP